MSMSVTDAARGTPRWSIAQRYERSFWSRLGSEIKEGRREQLDWYKWRADQLQSRLERVWQKGPLDRVLEIGSGPIGTVSFLEARERHAVDPLEHFYRTQNALVSLRSPGVTYHDGPGEQLPFESARFSLVVLDNVIDHTFDPTRILNEARRVLIADGLLYLAVNVHTPWGARLHDLMARLLLDPGHPFTYTSRALRRTLSATGYTVVDEQVDSYLDAQQADRHAASLTSKVKGYTGLSEFSHSVICRKDPLRVASAC